MTARGGTVATLRETAAMRSLVAVELTDGRHFALPRTAAETGGLCEGLALHPGMVEELAALQQRTAYQLALKRLSRWESSAAEITRYLQQRGFGELCAAETVEQLRADRVINDARVAESHVAVRVRRGDRGQQYVRRELAARGIDAALAQEAVSGLDDDAAAYAVALSRGRRRAWPDARAFVTVVGAVLQRRGFDYETSQRALRAAWSEIAGDARQDLAVEVSDSQL